MNTPKLQIAKISNRGNKFAIIAGKSILAKFKTAKAAKAELEKNRGFYEHWANSAGVSYENSDWVIIEI